MEFSHTQKLNVMSIAHLKSEQIHTTSVNKHAKSQHRTKTISNNEKPYFN